MAILHFSGRRARSALPTGLILLALSTVPGFSEERADIRLDETCLVEFYRPNDAPRTDMLIVIEPERVEPIASPAEIRWVEREIVLRPEELRYEVTPPVYETRIETVVIEPERLEYFIEPAELRRFEEEIIIRPAQQIWRPGRGTTERRNPETGVLEHLVELPAETAVVTRSEVVQPAQIRSILRPPVVRELEVEVLVRPAEIRTVIVPAMTTTIRVQEIVRPSEIIERVIAPRLAEIPRRLEIGEGAVEMMPALCATELPSDAVRALQRALRRAGYDAGPVDGQIGPATRSALAAFQGFEPLSDHIFLIETLKQLEIDPSSIAP